MGMDINLDLCPSLGDPNNIQVWVYNTAQCLLVTPLDLMECAANIFGLHLTGAKEGLDTTVSSLMEIQTRLAFLAST